MAAIPYQHEELKNLIVNTAALRTEIDNLLREDQARMMQKLDQVGDVVITILGRMDELKGLALAVDPKPHFSDQALSILRQFVGSGESSFNCIPCPNGEFILRGRRLNIKVDEHKFVPDDLSQLVAYGLLAIDYNPNGRHFYRITRNAAHFIAAVDGDATSTKLKDIPPVE